MKSCPFCSEDIQDDAIKCRFCGEWLEDQEVSPEIEAEPEIVEDEAKNITSGLGPNAEVPWEISGKWNWGAFIFGWLWAIGNHLSVYTILLVLIFGPFGHLWMAIKGNDYAWQSYPWGSVDHFKFVQKIWTYPALVIFALYIMLIVAAMLVK